MADVISLCRESPTSDALKAFSTRQLRTAVDEMDNSNVLIAAARNPKPDCFLYLFSKKKLQRTKFSQNYRGENILHACVRNEAMTEENKLTILRMTVCPKLVNQPDDIGMTPLMCSLMTCVSPLIDELLVERGARCDIVDHSGRSPLQQVMLLERYDVLNIMLATKTCTDFQALEAASQLGNLKIFCFCKM